MNQPRPALLCCCLLASAVAACGASTHPGSPDAAIEVDASDQVAFAYTPSWAGVTAVEVVGAFGQATDWTAPLVTLTAAGGTFTGAAHVPAGPHPYLFHVIGDAAAGAKAATAARYVLDPGSATFVACPAEAPTYTTAAANPCGVIELGQAAPTRVHVQGRVVRDAAPVAGFLVVLERVEADSHHFFVDRVTPGADGRYDFAVAPGHYRVQVQHPDFAAKTDAQLDPDALGVARRVLSSAVNVTAAVTIPDAEVAVHDYGKLAPRTTGKLPQTFTIGTAGGPATKLAVYGTGRGGAGTEIGDPWFAGASVKTGTTTFDGTFTTAQKGEPAVVLGERYFWGTERTTAADSQGVTFVVQSLVFPITWN